MAVTTEDEAPLLAFPWLRPLMLADVPPRARAALRSLPGDLRRLGIGEDLIAALCKLCEESACARPIKRRTTKERLDEVRALRQAAGAALQSLAILSSEDLAGVLPGAGAAGALSRGLAELCEGCDRQLFELEGVPIQARRAPSHHAELFTQVVAHRARYHGVKVSFGGLFLDLMSLCLNAAGMQTAAGTDLDPLPLVRREIAAEKSRERAFDRLLAQEEAKRKA